LLTEEGAINVGGGGLFGRLVTGWRLFTGRGGRDRGIELAGSVVVSRRARPGYQCHCDQSNCPAGIQHLDRHLSSFRGSNKPVAKPER
jgi:hypothetical protein